MLELLSYVNTNSIMMKWFGHFRLCIERTHSLLLYGDKLSECDSPRYEACMVCDEGSLYQCPRSHVFPALGVSS